MSGFTICFGVESDRISPYSLFPALEVPFQPKFIVLIKKHSAISVELRFGLS